MDNSVHNKLISFIWNMADDCLRDLYVRGKYRDVILPMVVLRRLDTLLEPTKEAVLAEVKFQKEEMQATELDDKPLKAASGYVFYNTSKWTLKSLFNTATNNRKYSWQTLKSTYLALVITLKKSLNALTLSHKFATWLRSKFCWMWLKNLSLLTST